jgi:hypothetical protein
MKPDDRVVEKGFVVVVANPSSVVIENLPLLVVCNKVYFPILIQGG